MKEQLKINLNIITVQFVKGEYYFSFLDTVIFNVV